MQDRSIPRRKYRTCKTIFPCDNNDASTEITMRHKSLAKAPKKLSLNTGT